MIGKFYSTNGADVQPGMYSASANIFKSPLNFPSMPVLRFNSMHLRSGQDTDIYNSGQTDFIRRDNAQAQPDHNESMNQDNTSFMQQP